jgi:hypothetical protein
MSEAINVLTMFLIDGDSASAKALKQELKQLTGLPTLLVRNTSTKYQPRWTDLIIQINPWPFF